MILEKYGFEIGSDIRTMKNFRVYWAVRLNMSDVTEMKEWCRNNCTSYYDHTLNDFGFLEHDDAMLFYLRFV